MSKWTDERLQEVVNACNEHGEQRAAMITPMIDSIADGETGGGNSCYWYKRPNAGRSNRRDPLDY